MLKTLLALYGGALNNVPLMLEKTDILVGSEIIDMSDTYTLHMDSKQKDLIVKALGKMSEFTIGQTFQEQEQAKKLIGHFTKNKYSNVIDLSKVELK